MDVNTALQEVLKTALIHDGLSRGIREAAKALDKLMTTRSLVSGWVSARLTERASPARLLVAVALSSRIMARNPQAKDVIEEYLEAKK